MPRRPEIGNVQLYPDRPLRKRDRNGYVYVLKFYCPLQRKRIRKNRGTRDRREARRILRECRERLLNGQYVDSGGAIPAAQEFTTRPPALQLPSGEPQGKSWQECSERYRHHQANRTRKRSLDDCIYGLHLVERILEKHRESQGLPEGLPVTQVMTLDMLSLSKTDLSGMNAAMNSDHRTR